MRRLIALCLGYFMVIVDATIVNVALPSLGRDLHASLSSLQWVLDGYTVVFAGLLLPAGALGDRIGSRRVFMAGLALFTLASAACAAAPEATTLIAARVVQGLGAAALVPSSLALLRALYRDPRERAHAVGAWGAVAGIGAASGPILGGVLVGLLGWRSVFLVNLPAGAGALWLSARHLPADGRSGGGGFDPGGQLTGVLTLGLLTFGLIEGGAAGWGSPLTALPLVGSAIALAVFLIIEWRSPRPMLPLGLFRAPTFSAASFVGLAINLGFYGQLFAISLYFQRLHGYSALQTGAALLPEGGAVALASALSGRAVGRVGPRRPMLVGLSCGMVGFAGLIAAGRGTPYPWLVAPLLVAGFGMATTMPAATAAIIEAAPAERAGIASGVLNAARQAGGAIGVALLGTLIAGAGLASGVQAAMAVSTAAFLLGALATWGWVERAGGRAALSRQPSLIE